MLEVIQITTKGNKKEDGERIARELVNNQLVACVQVVGPI